ncbi:MAG: hypothetical protein AAGC68_10300, partial [Verrucomicrobiota bacterium]
MVRFALSLVLIASAVTLEARLFTDDRGRQVEAELLGVNGSNVVLSRGGQSAQWPISKLSEADQVYVKNWLRHSSSKPRVRVSVWEREGVSSAGGFEESSKPGIPKTIPLLRETEEKDSYR